MADGQPSSKKAGVIGRTLRLMLGLLAGWMTFTVMRFENAAFHLLVLVIFLALMTFFTVLLFFINRRGKGLHPWFGSWLVVMPVVILVLFGGLSARLAAAAYVCISLLLQVIRSDVHCEVLLIPSILLNQPTSLLAALFFPIDWVEQRLSGPGGMPT